MASEKFFDFLSDAFSNMEKVMADDASIYVFHADTEGLNFRKAFDSAGFYLSGAVSGRSSPWCWVASRTSGSTSRVSTAGRRKASTGGIRGANTQHIPCIPRLSYLLYFRFVRLWMVTASMAL